MGRNAMHTPEQVFKVADDLAALGKEVTPNVLHAALGGGSMTTIYKHLAAWKEQRKLAAAPVPVAMPEVVLSSFNQVWQVAAQEAAKEVAAVREAAEASVKEAERNLSDAISTIARLENEADIESTNSDMLNRELSDTKRAANASATEAAKREAALAATVDQMRNQLAEQHTALERSHEEHQVFRQDKADEVGRLKEDFAARLAEQAQVLLLANSEVSSLHEKLTDSYAQLAAVREQERSASADLVKYQTASQNAEQQLADTRQLLDAANATVLEITSKLGIFDGRCEALRAQVESQENLIRGFAQVNPPEKKPTAKAKATPSAPESGKGEA
jgi:chromosome segregation ATPase